MIFYEFSARVHYSGYIEYVIVVFAQFINETDRFFIIYIVSPTFT